MKMNKKLLTALAAASVCLVILPCKVDASSEIKELKENTSYQIDLNGDKKKETIRYTTKGNVNGGVWLTIYVNNKKVYSMNCYETPMPHTLRRHHK